jgi:hypothetical protein
VPSTWPTGESIVKVALIAVAFRESPSTGAPSSTVYSSL